MQRPIPELPRLHDIGGKIVRKRAGVAINFQPIPQCQRINTAKLENTFRAAFETAQNGEQIRNDHIVPFANRINYFFAGKDAIDLAKPALQYLHVNSESESIQPADLNLLPPMRRRFGIQIIGGEALEPHMMRSANVIFRQNFFHHQVGLQSEWRRAKHGHQLGITF